VISTDLVEHFAVLRDGPTVIAAADGPIQPPPDVLAKMARPGDEHGLDIAHLVRVLALDDVFAWLVPGSQGVCLITWDRPMNSCSVHAGPIDDAVQGTFKNVMGSMQAGITLYRAIGLAPDDVIAAARSNATGHDEPIPVRDNVWTIAEEPSDGMITLQWRTLETQRLRVVHQLRPHR
jgi:hypothetical protein